jgi:creatinine amidohydrolase
MQLTRMRPEQIQDAVRRHVPVVIVAGSVEFHGPHLPVGTDYLIPQAVCDGVEARVECVVAPPLPFSSTMAWAASPTDGEVDFEPEALFVYARAMLRGLAAIGFGRIYIMQHHQGPEGLPVLCLKRAAAEVVRETVHGWGNGWGRRPPEELPMPGVFSWIQVAYIDSFSAYPAPDSERIPIGHGGRGETQLIQGALPETVRMGALASLNPLPPWLADAEGAVPTEGRRWLEFCIAGWVAELARGTLPAAGSE